MKRVITYGTFDLLHYGHINLLKRAKEYGDYLIVAVQDEDFILKTKPNAKILYTTEQRKELVGALRVVDEVVGYTDVDAIVKMIDFDVFAIGEDQNHEGFQKAVEWCKEKGKKIVRMRRTPGISSSDIKQKLISLE